MKKFIKSNLLIILIVLLASFLRIYKLDYLSLFGDELDVGYQAYSILKTGRDYSGNFMPLHFRSLAEWRTPLYLYSAVPTVSVFGISAWGVRLPAAIFGVLGVLFIYLLVNKISHNKALALLAALLLTISPWHLHYSRAGFEVTLMLFLLISGTYFFFEGLKNSKLLWPSAVLLGFIPWAYNTGKLFLPLIAVVLLLFWRRELWKLPRKNIFISLGLFLAVTVPFALNTLFGGGTQRIDYISIFNDPVTVPEIGLLRQEDLKSEGLSKDSPYPLYSRIFHNKYLSWGNTFVSNYLSSFSTDFLFLKGDLIPRHNSFKAGEMFWFEFVFIILGFYYFLKSKIDKKYKAFFLIWLFAAPIPSAFTQGGGSHASRLILMLPPLVILTAFGIYSSLSKKLKYIFIPLILLIYSLTFISMQHYYWTHYRYESERWWHSGFEKVIKNAVNLSSNYEKVIISSGDEPALIFFLAWSSYPPADFQKESQLAKVDLDGFGPSLKLGKYYFPEIGYKISLYDLGPKLGSGELYVAPVREINLDLVVEPSRLPNDLKLVDIILYPSGYPAFYIFKKP